MRLQIVSDLHTEFNGIESFFEVLGRKERGDVLVMAGDIANWKDRVATREILEFVQSEYAHTIWVAGNHEYYGSDPKAAVYHLEEVLRRGQGYPSVDVVYQPRVVTVGDEHFVCGTGWYPAANIEEGLGGDPEIGFFPEHGRLFQWSDFRRISFLNPWIYEQAAAFAALVADRARPDVTVISHMLPSQESVSKEYEDAATNAFFVHDLERVIATRQPKLWVHGHTHSSHDYHFGSTRVVCNPLGDNEGRSLDDYQALLIEI